MNKERARIRRGLKAKAIQKNSDRPKLILNRSNVHIYAQIVSRNEKGNGIVVSCSTLDKELRPKLKGTKVEQAYQVGALLAERAKSINVIDIAFDRAGYKYHGRVKALAEGARAGGLNF